MTLKNEEASILIKAQSAVFCKMLNFEPRVNMSLTCKADLETMCGLIEVAPKRLDPIIDFLHANGFIAIELTRDAAWISLTAAGEALARDEIFLFENQDTFGTKFTGKHQKIIRGHF